MSSLYPSVKWRSNGLVLTLGLVLADKLQDCSVEDLRLLPVRRVAGLWHDDGFRAFDASRKESKHRWGRVQVGIAGEQERRNLDPLERGERDSVPRRLGGPRGSFRPTRTLQF